MSLPTVETVMKWFLYGQDQLPLDFLSEALIRPANAITPKGVDKNEYMGSVGRFCVLRLS